MKHMLPRIPRSLIRKNMMTFCALQKFEDIFIFPHDGGVSIEIYQELYDIERTAASDAAKTPKRVLT